MILGLPDQDMGFKFEFNLYLFSLFNPILAALQGHNSPAATKIKL